MRVSLQRDSGSEPAARGARAGDCSDVCFGELREKWWWMTIAADGSRAVVKAASEIAASAGLRDGRSLGAVVLRVLVLVRFEDGGV